MWTRFKALFAWKDVFISGVWLYQRNSVTKQRRVIRISGGYSPINRHWLEGADV